MKAIAPFQNAEAIAAEIAAFLDADKYDYYGVRVLTICEEGDEDRAAPELGDILDNSRVWDDGDVTDEELPGVCALGITTDAPRSMIEEELRALDSTYAGRYVVLLGSQLAEGGWDRGEIIMKNAPVLAVWDRGNGTFRTLA